MFGAGVEYALHTVVNIGLQGERAASSRSLSLFQELSVPFVRKLLVPLGRAGILASTEGATGGWVLARPAASITVLDVAEAVQPDARLFECRNIRARCVLWSGHEPPPPAVAGTCSIHAVMLAAEAVARAAMARTTIHDLIEAVRAKSSHAHLTRLARWFDARRTERSADGTAGSRTTNE